MTAGRTPKQIKSLRESIWMPNRFSRTVRSFLVEAIFPSNISQTPESIRQDSAPCMSPRSARETPVKAVSIPK